MIPAHADTGLKFQRFTLAITSSTFLEYNGKIKSRIFMISTAPNNQLHILCTLALLSRSAIVTNVSADSSSSMDTEKNCDIAFRESMLGYPLFDSHFEIAVLDTYNASASSSCVRFLLFLSSCNFSCFFCFLNCEKSIFI